MKLGMFYQSIFYVLIMTLCIQASDSLNFNIKGFYLGMERKEVKEIYDNFKKNEVAKYISIESEKYRDLIQLDNEFSSMGNKIEIAYSEDGKTEGITFQYKTVDILFDAEKLSAEEFVKKFQKEYQIEEMKFEDMGIVKSWIYTDDKLNLKISIDGSKNLRLQKVSK